MSTILKALRRLEDDRADKPGAEASHAPRRVRATARRGGSGLRILAIGATGVALVAFFVWAFGPWRDAREGAASDEIAARTASTRVTEEPAVTRRRAPAPKPTRARRREAPAPAPLAAPSPAPVTPPVPEASSPVAELRAAVPVAEPAMPVVPSAQAPRAVRPIAPPAEAPTPPAVEPPPEVAVAPRLAPAPRPSPPAPAPRRTEIQAAKPAPVPAPVRPQPAPSAPPVQRAAPRAEPVAPPAPAPPRVTRREPSPPPPPLRPARASLPEVAVTSTVWHPEAERRFATLVVGGRDEPLRLREGDAVAGLVVLEIEPAAVVFIREGVEIRKPVGRAR